MSRPPNPKTKICKPVSARIDPLLRDKLTKMHPNDGDISKLIQALLQKYADGRILGIHIGSMSI